MKLAVTLLIAVSPVFSQEQDHDAKDRGKDLHVEHGVVIEHRDPPSHSHDGPGDRTRPERPNPPSAGPTHTAPTPVTNETAPPPLTPTEQAIVDDWMRIGYPSLFEELIGYDFTASARDKTMRDLVDTIKSLPPARQHLVIQEISQRDHFRRQGEAEQLEDLKYEMKHGHVPVRPLSHGGI
jgi:hypothetical protein